MALIPLDLTYQVRTTTDTYGLIKTFLDFTVVDENVHFDNISAITYDLSISGLAPGGSTVIVYSESDLSTPNLTVEISGYLNLQTLDITFVGTVSIPPVANYADITVASITEDVRDRRLRPISIWGDTDMVTSGTDQTFVVLKAFCNFSNATTLQTYGVWEKSFDGKMWVEIPPDNNLYQSITATELKTIYTTSGEIDTPDPSQTQQTRFYAITASIPTDMTYERYDCLLVPVADIKDCQIRFRLVTIKTPTTTPTVEFTLGEALILPIWGNNTEVLYSDLPNASAGRSLVYNKTLYTFGTRSKFPIIFVSDTGEFTSPLSKVIDIEGPSANSVTAVLPWRDYLLAATEYSLYLIKKSSSGSYVKTINSSVGISENDSRCAVAILNGILFKSGNRIFQLYPNLYSGDDTILNISDISKPISLELFSSEDAFAFSTETAYYLFLPKDTSTVCLKYDYTLRVWTKFVYPAHLKDYKIFSVDDIRVFGTYNGVYSEFQIESYLENHKSEAPEDVRENLLYGDYITAKLTDLASTGIGADAVTPIPYLLDTGQKIDKISYTKQFTEAKFVFNTMSDKDRFPCTIQVHVDGDPRVHTINVNTDSSFWTPANKFQNTDTTDDNTLTLNVDSYTSEAELLDTFRQLIIRYSGKGKSIRFILSGTSVYPFKINSILSRYRTLNVKQ